MTGSKSKTQKRRLDAVLVDRGLAKDLAAARALIMAGQVVVDDQRLDKAGAMIGPDATVRTKGRLRGEGAGGEGAAGYVSRGGNKLASALEAFDLTSALKGAVVLDVGASTGGFTDCCLSHGAARVLALDVGTNQLAWELRQDPRVVVLEGQDIRAFDPSAQPPIEIVVGDISFNSLVRLAPALVRAAPLPGVRFVLLVKPQFELKREDVPAGGVVTDEGARAAAAAAVVRAFANLGIASLGQADSKVAGRQGNREIFIHLRRPVA